MDERSGGGGLYLFHSPLPLRPLLRVASDYSSESVVCFEVLRPLRPLREIKIRVFFSHRNIFSSHDDYFSHAKSAEGAKILSPFLFTLALEWSQTSLRREGAESLSTPSPPVGVLAPVSGGESVTTASTAPANCPPETGGTRSVATEGVDDTNGLAEFDERRRLL